jgi:hypothetical protein
VNLPPDLSVLVPVTERPGPLEEIYGAIRDAVEAAGFRPEFLFLVEPGFRTTTDALERLSREGHPVRVLHTGHVLGESALLKLGAERARSSRILTHPPYWRLRPGTLPTVLSALEDPEVDLVMARRWPRKDSGLNRLQNRVYHALLRPRRGEVIHDVACGVRGILRDTLLDLPLYGDFHRFLPLIAQREGYRVVEVDAEQHPEDESARVYSPGVYVSRIIDIVGIQFLLRFTEKPLRFFGLVGGLSVLAGGGILGLLAAQRMGGEAVADRPLLLLGALLLVLGVQAIALGLIGEIVVHLSAASRKPYRLLRSPSSSLPGEQGRAEGDDPEGGPRTPNLRTPAGHDLPGKIRHGA